MNACEICEVLFPYINSCATRGKMSRLHVNRESDTLKIDKNAQFEYLLLILYVNSNC